MHGRHGRKDRVTIFLIMQPKYKRTLMIYMWFTGINYYKLAVEKDRDSIFTTMHDDRIWKPGFTIASLQPKHRYCVL